MSTCTFPPGLTHNLSPSSPSFTDPRPSTTGLTAASRKNSLLVLLRFSFSLPLPLPPFFRLPHLHLSPFFTSPRVHRTDDDNGQLICTHALFGRSSRPSLRLDSPDRLLRVRIVPAQQPSVRSHQPAPSFSSSLSPISCIEPRSLVPPHCTLFSWPNRHGNTCDTRRPRLNIAILLLPCLCLYIFNLSLSPCIYLVFTCPSSVRLVAPNRGRTTLGLISLPSRLGIPYSGVAV